MFEVNYIINKTLSQETVVSSKDALELAARLVAEGCILVTVDNAITYKNIFTYEA